MSFTLNTLDATYLGRKGSWFIFEDELGNRFEFDDVKANLIEKFKLRDPSSKNLFYNITYKVDLDENLTFEETVIVGMRQISLDESA